MSFTWRYVLTTRNEFETESDTTDAQKPIRARRASHTIKGCFGGSAMCSERKLYYKSQCFFHLRVLACREESLTVPNQG